MPCAWNQEENPLLCGLRGASNGALQNHWWRRGAVYGSSEGPKRVHGLADLHEDMRRDETEAGDEGRAVALREEVRCRGREREFHGAAAAVVAHDLPQDGHHVSSGAQVQPSQRGRPAAASRAG